MKGLTQANTFKLAHALKQKELGLAPVIVVNRRAPSISKQSLIAFNPVETS